MPTNEERSKVAARLRELDTSRLYDGMDEVCALEDACGCDVGQDWQDMELKDRLAELIEPEPERTCEVTEYNDYGPHAEDCTIVFSCGHKTLGYIPNYCPSCGAEVVS